MAPIVTEQRPDPSIEAIFAAALLHHQSGQHEAAASLYGRILCHLPQHYGALQHLGVFALQRGQAALAVMLITRAVHGNNRVAAFHANLGLALKMQGKAHDAVRCLTVALVLDPALVDAANNLANALLDLLQLEKARLICARALLLAPLMAGAHHNMALICHKSGALDAAKVRYRTAIALRPDDTESLAGLGVTQLLAGDMPQGWRLFEFHRRTPAMRSEARFPPATLWQGESLLGRTILLHGDQGLGDAIQFCRYAPMVAAKGGRVLLEVPAPLVRLLRGLPGIAAVISRGEPLPHFDGHCPLMSLPAIFGTSLADIPSPRPYLKADLQGAEYWRRTLPAAGRRIGLAWQGNQYYRNDRNRSIPADCLDLLAGLAAERDILFVSVQKSPTALPRNLPLLDPMGEIDDLADSAALVEALDLIITIDSAVAHLAAALGKPVWLMNRFDSDWRWLLGCDASPWYPTLRIFRQLRPGDWPGVVDAVAAALRC